MVMLVPFPTAEFKRDGSAMRFDKLARQRKAKAEGGFAAGGARSVEAREHLLLLLGRNARAVVDHNDHRIFIVPAGLEPDVATFVGIGDGVAQDMFDGLAEPTRIADDAARARLQR